ncbi:unnamed protein product [Leptosia nina]|uniref:Uncharacterized protein n=1 Tax=Leptosia nina TaxID=320188 RepID=A0AAV1JZ40_9NEOP
MNMLQRRFRIARRRTRRGGRGRGAPAAPLADHVDLFVGLEQLPRRSHLPLLGHEAARHGGCICLSATASARNRRTEKRERERAPRASGVERSHAFLLRCELRACDTRYILSRGGARAALRSVWMPPTAAQTLPDNLQRLPATLAINQWKHCRAVPTHRKFNARLFT